MAKLNTSSKNYKSDSKTHEGASAKRINAEQALRRSVMSCLLWESSFYEDGQLIADRICALVQQNKPEVVAQLAIEAREKMKLRHIPLLLVRELARHIDLKGRRLVASTLERVIQRADELTEFLSIYWKDKREKLSAQVKKGLARAFVKFSAYDLAKYNKDSKIKLRDVLFLCHAKPKDEEQANVWKKLIDGSLESPDTWEVALSAGKNKKETFERLIKEKNLGALALIRNLRNMIEAKVEAGLIREALGSMKVERVLPFRFITSARYAPKFEPELEQAIFKALQGHEKLSGKTILLVDVSGSMYSAISSKSEATRIDVACGLAVLAREICDDISIYAFSNETKLIPNRRGFALRDSINTSMPHGGTDLGGAINYINTNEEYDRLIVFTDEQSHTQVNNPKAKGYMVNVSCEKNGIGYGKWTHIDGFSEQIINYIIQSENISD